MKRILLILLGLGLMSQMSRSQGLNSDGRDFYVGYVAPSVLSQNIDTTTLGFFGAFALVSSYRDNEVTLNYFDANGNEVNKKTYTVMQRRSVQIPLDTKQMQMTEPGEMPEWKTCHITSRLPINVSYFSTGACAGGSYLAISTSALGRQYVVQSYRDNEGGVGGVVSKESSSGFFMIMAAFDGTTVEITPSATTKMKRPGVNCGVGATGSLLSFSIALNKGQCYLVKGAADGSGCDISGSTVIADKPVAVLAGHENAFTDGSDPNAGGARPLEGRDFMVEQMLPVEFWDSTGYVSIPFVDSKAPINAGEGDEYRVFSGILPTMNSNGPSGSNAEMNSGARSFNGIAPYSSPPYGVLNWTSPANIYSTNGTKIGVAMYDQRAQGGGSPYPTPSQMTIIPQTRWRRTALFYVPNNSFENLQGYYISLICSSYDYNNSKILIAFNGGRLMPINSSGIAVKRKYSTISGHPELVGYSLAMGPGAYLITLDTGARQSFAAYNYGFRGVDPTHTLGDFDANDFFFSYAAPTAFAKQGDIETSGKLQVTVDTLCDRWHICVRDARATNRGIKSLQIVDDPGGDIIGTKIQSHNVRFDLKAAGILENYPYEINLPGTDSNYCVDVFPEFTGDTSFLALYVLDNEGHGKLLTLSKRALSLVASASPNLFRGRDTVLFPTILAGADTCVTLSFYNAAPKGDASISVNAVSVQQDSGFTITGMTPVLPAQLTPGDTLTVHMCFSLNSVHTGRGLLTVHTACADESLVLVGAAANPLIYATDKDFGKVVIGTTKCDTITVRNLGAVPFTLTDTILHTTVLGNQDFTWDYGSPLNKNRLPAVLQPGQFIRLSFCFTPTVKGFDSMSVDWKTDVAGTYKDSLKSWTSLKGTGMVPGVYWDRDSNLEFADSLVSPITDTVRVYIKNLDPVKAFVQNVYFEGEDRDEFSILANQYGYSPLEGFTMEAGDSFWVDIVWLANLGHAYPNTYRDRHATLVATFRVFPSGTDSTVMFLTRSFNLKYNDVPRSDLTPGADMHSIVADGRLLVWLPSDMRDPVQFELFDVLGRRVFGWPQGYSSGPEGHLTLPIPQLARGLYVLRGSNGGRVAACKVVCK